MYMYIHKQFSRGTLEGGQRTRGKRVQALARGTLEGFRV